MPNIQFADDIIPKGNISQNTQAALQNDSITYNETGVTFNDSRYHYGGVYKYGQDIVPLLQLANNPIPSLYGGYDIYTPAPTRNHNSIGPGFFMYITNN